MVHNFTHATLGRTGLKVFRLGLSASYLPGRKGILSAIDAGVNYLFAFGIDLQMVWAYRTLPSSVRQNIVLATGAYNYIWTRQNLRRTLERRLRQFRTDVIDVFLFLGVMKPGEFPEHLQEQLCRLREEGKVRAVGLSCHHRKFAGELASRGAMDVLMIRYNAAHRGAEQDIFPLVPAHNVGVTSYTATRWTFMMRQPKNWPPDGRVPTAPEAYRFVLSNPAVDVCLMAPRNAEEIRQNIAALSQGPLNGEELTFLRSFGDAVHADKRYFM